MPSPNAGRESLRRRIRALEVGRSHLVETTLSGSGILRHIQAARRRNFWIILHYVSLGSVDRALDRIRSRVALGGHEVPDADVRRRFKWSHSNLPIAAAMADEILIYDNSDPYVPHKEIVIFKERNWWIAENLPD